MHIEITRATDAARANEILNDPSVRPFIAETPDGPIDISAQAADPNNYLLVGEYGLALFRPVILGSYEVHSASLRAGRGEWTLQFARACLDWMFSRSNAWEILTRVPAGHLPALALTKACGYVWEFESPNPCLFRGRKVGAATWRLSIHDWVARSAHFLEIGEWLHKRLAEEATKLGVKEPPHPDEAHHSRVAGAALEMARHGQVLKSVFYYSRWSALARHGSVSLVSVDPPVLKMDIGFLHLRGDDIEVTRDETPIR